MYDESLVFLIRETILLTLKIIMPILGAGVAIGLLISIFQSVTSIQDQTLTFVPKIVVMLGVVVFLTPWIMQRLVDFASKLFYVALP
ncbi:MAG: flagellar biosynthetic protein FliQ [Phycisphaera sp.]|nr:MAG: flagellar biosynthetic protein FliQ [Phycisphaera sp.]